jgi:hypothetical protein
MRNTILAAAVAVLPFVAGAARAEDTPLSYSFGQRYRAITQALEADEAER